MSDKENTLLSLKNKADKNNVSLIGKLISSKIVWQSIDHITYEGIMRMDRSSGIYDDIPILYADKELAIDSIISVKGQFRSRDIDDGNKLKV